MEDNKLNNILTPTIPVQTIQPQPVPTPLKTNQSNDIPSWLAPVNRTKMAIAAGYLGMFAILIFPAPISMLVGILALVGLKKHQEKIGKGRAWFGTIMGILGTGVIIWAIIANITHK